MSEASRRRPPPAAPARIGCWHILFVRSCNLRCTYCATDHGTLAGSAARMSDRVFRGFIDIALAAAPADRKITFDFCVGETLCAPRRFLAAVDALRERAAAAGVEAAVQVSTNGTLLGPALLEELARRGVSLSFSIDAPPGAHDRQRRDRRGMGTHARALRAWRRWRALTGASAAGAAGSVQSVYTAEADIFAIADFWRSEGEKIFNLVVQLPAGGRHSPEQVQQWHGRQRRYLDDLRRWADAAAERFSAPAFLGEYEGPRNVMELWRRIYLGERSEPCGAGISVAAVDETGRIFPCEGYLRTPQRAIGSVEEGFDGGRLGRFLRARERAIAAAPCATCLTGEQCDRPCLAAIPQRSALSNYCGGCRFGQQVYRVAADSLQRMESRAADRGLQGRA